MQGDDAVYYGRVMASASVEPPVECASPVETACPAVNWSSWPPRPGARAQGCTRPPSPLADDMQRLSPSGAHEPGLTFGPQWTVEQVLRASLSRWDDSVIDGEVPKELNPIVPGDDDNEAQVQDRLSLQRNALYEC